MDEKKYLDNMNSINNFIGNIKNSSINIVNIYKEMSDNTESLNKIIDILFDDLKDQFKQMKNSTGLNILIDYIILEETNDEIIEETFDKFININYINYLLMNNKFNILNKLYEKANDKEYVLDLVNNKANKINFFNLNNNDLNSFINYYGLDIFNDKNKIINNICNMNQDKSCIKNNINPNIYLENYTIVSDIINKIINESDYNDNDQIEFIKRMFTSYDINLIYTFYKIIPEEKINKYYNNFIFNFILDKDLTIVLFKVISIFIYYDNNAKFGFKLLTDFYEYLHKNYISLNNDEIKLNIKSYIFNRYDSTLYKLLMKSNIEEFKEFKNYYKNLFKDKRYKKFKDKLFKH